MLEKFGSALKNTISKIAGAIFLDKKQIEAITKELRKAMFEADIDLKITKELVEKIQKKALEKTEGLDKREQLIKFIHDELTTVLGEDEYKLKVDKKKKPHKIMLAGLYGSGKTTTAVKLAFYYMKRGFRTCVLGLDVHRPAAPEQLEQFAKKSNIPCFIDKQEKNALKIWENYKSKIKKYDLCIIDTAGRDALSKDLIDEIKLLHKTIEPHEMMFVLPADIGKTVSTQAKEFNKVGKITGVIITRLDGTAKGGGALVSCAETGAHVLFVGVGEKPEDIESFDPSSFVSRLLGMGDLKALLEKASTVLEEKEQKKMQKRMKEGKFTLDDFYKQIGSMQKMGPLNKVANLIPGLGGLTGAAAKKLPDMFNVQEGKMKRWRYAIDSMTFLEKEEPEKLNSSRISRISKGSHVSATEIRELIKQYKVVKEFTSSASSLQGLESGQMDRKTLQKLAKKFGRKMF